jgi:hypothetical protein
MRDAIGPCSKDRVFETGEENVDLKRIFRKIESLVGNQRELPWSYERAHELIGSDDVRILEDNGVLLGMVTTSSFQSCIVVGLICFTREALVGRSLR